jgi:hypothetical protein
MAVSVTKEVQVTTDGEREILRAIREAIAQAVKIEWIREALDMVEAQEKALEKAEEDEEKAKTSGTEAPKAPQGRGGHRE